MSDDDVALMLEFVAGREDAFVELYRRYRDRIVTFTTRMLGERARAEEAAQEVFLKLYRSRNTYQSQSRFSTFLYRIATNHCLNQRARVEHKVVQRDVDAEQVADTSASQHENYASQQLQAALNAALAKLPERQRAALLLVHYDGLTYREAAESLEISEPAVKSLIHRARGSMLVDLQPLLGRDAEVHYAL